MVKRRDTPRAAHVHAGPRGVNGPIVIPLTPPTSGDPGALERLRRDHADLARKIKDRPRQYYFNVHTEKYPAGAIRGQLRLK